eukprot:5894-Heterococcus_DN1.PRE.2
MVRYQQTTTRARVSVRTVEIRQATSRRTRQPARNRNGTSVTIYALKLQGNKYYVGRTEATGDRMRAHANGSGCAWTRLHPFVSVLFQKDNCTVFDEDKETVMLMEKHGIDNVRGGSYSEIDLSIEKKRHIELQFNSARDRCTRCGRASHWRQSCYAATRAD